MKGARRARENVRGVCAKCVKVRGGYATYGARSREGCAESRRVRGVEKGARSREGYAKGKHTYKRYLSHNCENKRSSTKHHWLMVQATYKSAC